MKEKKSKRLAIMMKHRELVRKGAMEVAHVLLRLLRRGEATLNYGDAEYAAEQILEKLGCFIRYSGSHYLATAYDFGRG